MKEITAKEVNYLVQQGKEVNIIDVREVDEVVEGMIPKAVHIPLGLIESHMDELERTKEYIIVCQAGGRSSRAAAFLEGHGFKVINMQDGMLAWDGEMLS